MRSTLRLALIVVVIASVSCLGNKTCVGDWWGGEPDYRRTESGGLLHGDSGRIFDVGDHATDWTPRWSSDGQTLVVNVRDHLHGVHAIYGVRADGSAMWRIPEEPEGVQLAPVVLPNDRVAYLNYEWISRGFIGDKGSSPHHRHVVVSSLDGKSEQWRVKLPISHSKAWGLTWIDDLKRLAVIMVRGHHRDDFDGWTPGSGFNMFTVGSSGHVVPMGINNATQHVDGPVLSPDGQKVAYVARYSNCLPIQKIYNHCPREQILMADLRERGIENIKTTGGIYDPSRMAWSPDGERLFYSYGERLPQGELVRTPIMAMATDGTTELIAEIEPDDRVFMVQPSPNGKYLLLISTRWERVGLVVLDDASIIDVCCRREHRSQFLWASWSPDGSYIALLDEGRGPRDVLVLVKPDLSERKTLLRSDSDGNVVLAQEDGSTQFNPEPSW